METAADTPKQGSPSDGSYSPSSDPHYTPGSPTEPGDQAANPTTDAAAPATHAVAAGAAAPGAAAPAAAELVPLGTRPACKKGCCASLVEIILANLVEQFPHPVDTVWGATPSHAAHTLLRHLGLGHLAHPFLGPLAAAYELNYDLGMFRARRFLEAVFNIFHRHRRQANSRGATLTPRGLHDAAAEAALRGGPIAAVLASPLYRALTTNAVRGLWLWLRAQAVGEWRREYICFRTHQRTNYLREAETAWLQFLHTIGWPWDIGEEGEIGEDGEARDGEMQQTPPAPRFDHGGGECKH